MLLAAGLAIGCSGDRPSSVPDLAGPRLSLASLGMTPAKSSIAVGGTVQLKAIAHQPGGAVDTTAVFTWKSFHPEIATVDAKGLVRGVAVGGTSIQAATGGLAINAFVTVTAGATVGSVTVSPARDSLQAGAQVQLTATVKDSSGSVLTGQAVTWSTSAPTVANVDTAGLVKAVASGSAVITAASGGKQSQASLAVVAVSSGTTTTPAKGTIMVNLAGREQTITGWEADAAAVQYDSNFLLYRDTLLSLAQDLGITRLRLEVRSSIESTVANPTGCQAYAVINDDADPYHLNPAGFQFARLDSSVERLVVPYRAKLAARGTHLYLNAEYVAFNKSCGNVAAVHQNPQEYAEFALAVFQHLSQKYGIVPDSWEMILEPDNTTPFTGKATLMGQALVATAQRLAAAGFHPAFVGPSTKVASTAPIYFDSMMAVPGVNGLLSELSYHRYGTAPTIAVLNTIGQRAQSYGIRSSMLERIGADYNQLIDDLLHARVSAWQQYTLAFTTTDNGGHYFGVDNTNPSQPKVTAGNRTRYLRQFFHYVQPGATRVDATNSQGGLTPVAFQNADGRAVVVIRATAAAAFTVGGLPAGTYGVRYTTAGASDAPAGGDQAIAAGQLVSASIPAAGVLTIFQR